MGKNILVIAAHPDDEVLGCGGTIAKLSGAGHEVCVLILGEGISSRDEKRDRKKREQEIKALKVNIETANSILETKKIFTFDLYWKLKKYSLLICRIIALIPYRCLTLLN
jgi:N-acetylglucosamine malate deacetylase 1